MFLPPHALETLFGSLVLGRLLCAPTAISPAIAVDNQLYSPERYIVLDDGVVEFPLDPPVTLLQIHVELAEVVGGHLGPRRRGSLTGSIRHVVRASRLAMLLAHDTIRLVHVRREELVQPDLHRPQPLVLVQPTDVRLSQK